MRNRLWLTQIPVIAIFVILFLASKEWQSFGFDNRRLAPLQSISEWVGHVTTNLKFRVRGPQPVRNKIVIVEIDGISLEKWGRWPWHRDQVAHLIDKSFSYGAKTVGLDMVFSEADERVPLELQKALQKKGDADLIGQFETDLELVKIIKKHSSSLVLGWMTESLCYPGEIRADRCPVTDPEAIGTQPPWWPKFSIRPFQKPKSFDPQKINVSSLVTLLPNLEIFSAPALHSGFLNSQLDEDGVIRKSPLIIFADSRPYPQLGLEMARIGLQQNIIPSLGHRLEMQDLALGDRKISVDPQGLLEINFRGPGRTFQYVSADDVLSKTHLVEDPVNKKLTGLKKEDLFKDAYVLIGISAVGVFDMRNFPFDSNVPGVEGQATVLDNILSGDEFQQNHKLIEFISILFMMIFGALLISWATERLEATYSVTVFFSILAIAGTSDIWLFNHRHNFNTGLLVLELAVIFVITTTLKYFYAEKSKKFLRMAFSRYVSPAIVDSLVKDASQLRLGGEKKNLSILFSDIRGFTTFSETVDAPELSQFLNEYLGFMTDIVFKYQGTVDKYIGDAVMCFWGAPLPQPTHAALACQAAIEMIQTVHRQKDHFKEKWNMNLEIGIGVGTGLVNVGNMGTQQNFEYTAIGDVVNLTSRLESLTKFYGLTILCTRPTYEAAYAHNPLLKFREIDFVRVKGKYKPVDIFELLVKDLSSDYIETFSKAKKLYLSRQFTEAQQLWNKAKEIYKKTQASDDKLSQVFIDRCDFFITMPPPMDWDGSWKMDEK